MIRTAATKKRSATSLSRKKLNEGSPVLRLFKRMVADVPAYKKFLESNSVAAETIEKISDIERIPVMSKNSYLREYPYKDLFWGGTLAVPHIMTSTSGSTGKPFYFARSFSVDEQSAFIHERFFMQSSLSKTKSTLVIVCFGMGVWIGGLITYQAFQTLGKKGYPISVITPGINKNEILKALQQLAPHYDQIILAGYPPFIKDVLDDTEAAGISFAQHRIAIVFAAEAFIEQFRDYVASKTGIQNVLTDTMNIYGSADLGTMAAETPLSILIRRLAAKKPEIFKEIFGNISKTPTLAQYIPEYTNFEAVDGQLLVTGDSAMPLCRYAIGDHGAVLSFSQIKDIFSQHGIDLQKEIREHTIDPQLLKLPFVYVYERSDLSTTLYGLQIYPETIREVLLEDAFNPFVTGRFALAQKYDENHDQYLEINIELKRAQEATEALSSSLCTEIIRNLKLKNGEFKELYSALGDRTVPRLVFWPHEDPIYFRRDIKQRWVIKTE
ncbi:MAG TPA: hypothetical protein VMU25_04295 [Candidatus Paceibacterota bacterium]|nr:hypothetical protein [Candidatus Paceibacterota bacterium]